MPNNHFTSPFSPKMKMADLMNYNYRLLLVLSRFGIPLGFGEKSVAEVCQQHGVEAENLLLVADLVLHLETGSGEATQKIKYVPPLLQYLQNSHLYFLEHRLPFIRKELAAFLESYKDESLSQTFLRFFDEYATEVQEHMDYEDKTVFPYIRLLLAGTPPKDYAIAQFIERHNDIEEKLADLKNIIIKYIPVHNDRFQTNNILLDICTCEEDLHTHSVLEDLILIPAVGALEKQMGKQ